MSPSSYQAPNRGDDDKKNTVSQSTESNLSSASTTVAQLIEKKENTLFSIAADDTIAEAVMKLKTHKIGALLVLDSEANLEGILSERDIVRGLADTPGQTLPQKVAELMTTKVVTCSPEDLLVSVLQNMTEGRFRHVPVMDNGKLSGMVTIGDVIHYRLNELEYEALKMKQLIVG